MSGHTNYSCSCMDIIVKYARAGKKLLFGLKFAACRDLNDERTILKATRYYVPCSIYSSGVPA